MEGSINTKKVETDRHREGERQADLERESDKELYNLYKKLSLHFISKFQCKRL